MKKSHIRMTFIGSVKQLAEGSIPWRETSYFKEIEHKLFSVLLSGARYREGLTQVQLAERTCISLRHISEMENNKRPIGKRNAHKLAEVINIEPRHFIIGLGANSMS